MTCVDQGTDARERPGRCFMEAADSLERKALHLNARIIDIREAADLIAKLGNLLRGIAIEEEIRQTLFDRAVGLYELAAKKPGASVTFINDLAHKTSCLDARFNERAAALYELAAKKPGATHYQIRHIARNMRDLGFEERAKDLLKRAAAKESQESAQKNEN